MPPRYQPFDGPRPYERKTARSPIATTTASSVAVAAILDKPVAFIFSCSLLGRRVIVADLVFLGPTASAIALVLVPLAFCLLCLLAFLGPLCLLWLLLVLVVALNVVVRVPKISSVVPIRLELVRDPVVVPFDAIVMALRRKSSIANRLAATGGILQRLLAAASSTTAGSCRLLLCLLVRLLLLLVSLRRELPP